MSIKVLYDAFFFDVTRCHEETVQSCPATVNDLIQELSRRYGPAFRDCIISPDTRTPRPQITILVNGRHQAWDAPIPGGAEVTFLVPIAGGGF